MNLRISQHHTSSCGIKQQLVKFIWVNQTFKNRLNLLYSHEQNVDLSFEMQVQLVEVKPDKQTDDAIHIVLYG